MLIGNTFISNPGTLFLMFCQFLKIWASFFWNSLDAVSKLRLYMFNSATTPIVLKHISDIEKERATLQQLLARGLSPFPCRAGHECYLGF